MKLHLDLHNSLPLKFQLEAVNIYINKYRYSQTGFDTELNIKPTPKDIGFKIETSYGSYHVSCKKTKKGIYKFKVWQAV